MKKLITIAWSTTVQVDVPEGATIDSLNDIGGEHADLGAKIVRDATDNFRWKDAEITDVQVEE